MERAEAVEGVNRVTVEEDCQEGAQKRKAEKKWRQTRAAKTEGSRAK